jgi:hypothetical protein
MAITSILAAAQGGAFYSNVASATGLSETTVTKAINAFAPAIAEKLKAKAAADPEAFENLLDLLEDGDGSDLNDPDAITGAEAISDGNEILQDLYGSADAAATALVKLAPSVDDDAAAKLGPISATSVLAALAAANAQTLTGNAAPAASSGGGGILSTIISALVAGLVKGAVKQMAPKRRRRRYTSYYGRRPVRRRRRSTPGLESIFKDILTGRK